MYTAPNVRTYGRDMVFWGLRHLVHERGAGWDGSCSGLACRAFAVSGCNAVACTVASSAQ